HEDNPAAIRRNFGKAIAHAVIGSTLDWLRLAAFPVVEGNSVEVVLDLGFFGRVGMFGKLLALGVRLPRFRACKNHVLAVGTPDAVGLDVARIISAGQGLPSPR